MPKMAENHSGEGFTILLVSGNLKKAHEVSIQQLWLAHATSLQNQLERCAKMCFVENGKRGKERCVLRG